MDTIDRNLQRLVSRIVATAGPEAIYLFGSRARGEGRADSDYDLLVIVPDEKPKDAWSLKTLARIPRDPGIPADLVACRRSVFERRKTEVGTLSHRAVSEGRLVYGG
jgi:uncharacterized protein